MLNAVWKGTSMEGLEENPEREIVMGKILKCINSEESEEGDYLPSIQEAVEEKEVVRVIFPISIQKYYDLFLADSCDFSFKDHYSAKQGYKEVSSTNWKKLVESDLESREISMIVPLKGVPFKTQTRCYRAETLKKEEFYPSILIPETRLYTQSPPKLPTSPSAHAFTTRSNGKSFLTTCTKTR